MITPTPIPTVKQKVLSFYDKMKFLKEFLTENNAPADLQIIANQLPLEFYIDKAAVVRLIRIAMQEDFENFGVYFGVETFHNKVQPDPDEPKSFGKLTGCFVGLNKDGGIIKCHCKKSDPNNVGADNGIPPEETWPPPSDNTLAASFPTQNCFTLASYRQDIEAFFSPPPPEPSCEE